MGLTGMQETPVEDVVEDIVDEFVGTMLTLIATNELHGVEKNAQEALGRDVARVVAPQPPAVDASFLHKGRSEALDAFRFMDDVGQQLSFWTFLHRRNWWVFKESHF